MSESAHMADIQRGRGYFKVVCWGAGFSGCDFGGQYPTREHARAVLDLHLIRTHATGNQIDGKHSGVRHAGSHCQGCAAVRRVEQR